MDGKREIIPTHQATSIEREACEEKSKQFALMRVKFVREREIILEKYLGNFCKRGVTK